MNTSKIGLIMTAAAIMVLGACATKDVQPLEKVYTASNPEPYSCGLRVTDRLSGDIREATSTVTKYPESYAGVPLAQVPASVRNQVRYCREVATELTSASAPIVSVGVGYVAGAKGGDTTVYGSQAGAISESSAGAGASAGASITK